MRPRAVAARRVSLFGVAAAALLLLWTALPPAAHAQSPIDVELTAEPVEVTVGDVIGLTLTVTHPEGYEVAPVDLPREWGDLEVVSQTRPETSGVTDGIEVTTQTIEAVIFSTGDFETPELAVTVRDQTGRLLEEPAPRASITVLSVLQEGDDTPRDIRPQATLWGPAVWPWVVGGLLIALLAVLVGWAAYRRFRSTGVPQAPPVLDLRSPYEIVVGELERIAALRLPEAGRFKEHYTLVSDALRTYVSGVYRVPALDLTTGELGAMLRRAKVETPVVEQSMGLLDDCDLVKFARYAPGVAEAGQIVPRALGLVEEAHRPPEAVQGPHGAVSGEALG